MSNDKEIRKVSFEEVFGPGKQCDKEAELRSYFEGTASQEESRAMEGHLKECHACARRLAELDREEEAIRAGSPDADRANRILEANRLKLRAALDVQYPLQPPAQVGGFSRGLRLPPYMNAVMALLLVALLYPAYRGFYLERERDGLEKELLTERGHSAEAEAKKQAYEQELRGLQEERRALIEPSLSGSVVYSARQERGSGRPMVSVNFTAQNDGANLVFALPHGDFEACAAEILSGTGSVWRNEIRPIAPLISVHLRRGSLKNGDYLLRLSGVKGKTETVIAEYKLKISSD